MPPDVNHEAHQFLYAKVYNNYFYTHEYQDEYTYYLRGRLESVSKDASNLRPAVERANAKDTSTARASILVTMAITSNVLSKYS